MWGTSDSDWWWLMAVVLVLGMGLGWVVFDGIPMLWHVVKPLIHAITG